MSEPPGGWRAGTARSFDMVEEKLDGLPQAVHGVDPAADLGGAPPHGLVSRGPLNRVRQPFGGEYLEGDRDGPRAQGMDPPGPAVLVGGQGREYRRHPGARATGRGRAGGAASAGGDAARCHPDA